MSKNSNVFDDTLLYSHRTEHNSKRFQVSAKLFYSSNLVSCLNGSLSEMFYKRVRLKFDPVYREYVK